MKNDKKVLTAAELSKELRQLKRDVYFGRVVGVRVQKQPSVIYAKGLLLGRDPQDPSKYVIYMSHAVKTYREDELMFPTREGEQGDE